MAKALKTNIRRKNKSCKAWLVQPCNSIHNKYNTYTNILRKYLKDAEINYYEELFANHKNSVYDLRKTLNPIINPKRGKSFSPVNKLMTGRKAIVDKEKNIKLHE